MIHDDRLGPNQDVRMAAINADLHTYNTAHRVSSSIGELRITNLYHGATNWSELKGPLIKAANTRHLLPFMQVLCDRWFADPADVFHRTVSTLVAQACRLYHILYNAELFLQQQELDDLQDCLGQIGHNLMLARHLADTKCRMYFQVTHKCHWVQHLWHQAI